jgi:hypothetical protein
VTAYPPPSYGPSSRPAYRPPRDCPVCSSRLEITQLGCPSCGTGLSGHFAPCQFCGLDDGDLTMLRVFLASRGNMRDLERHLGVSYPTARARFDDLLRRLGLIGGNGQPGTDAGGAGAAASSASMPEAERLATLKALAEGRLDVESARQRLAGD